MFKFRAKLWRRIPKEVCGDLLEKYKDLKDDYYNIIFFDNLEDMYKLYDKKFGKYDEMEHNYNGLCKNIYSIYDDNSISKSQGYILYYFDEMGASTMVHEISHAITFYFKERIQENEKIFDDTNVSSYNELFCYMMGNLMYQVNNKYWEYYNKKD